MPLFLQGVVFEAATRAGCCARRKRTSFAAAGGACPRRARNTATRYTRPSSRAAASTTARASRSIGISFRLTPMTIRDRGGTATRRASRCCRASIMSTRRPPRPRSRSARGARTMRRAACRRGVSLRCASVFSCMRAIACTRRMTRRGSTHPARSRSFHSMSRAPRRSSANAR
ncbi:hypothetical protein CXQ84_10435 [Burkholderia pseudomallei]|nr:hypothetical protein CXQ84_10435 [Burkholderia pseudomallei]